MVCRLPNPLTATEETSCSTRIVPSLSGVGGRYFLKRTVVPGRNNTKAFALKPPKQPVAPETEEAEEVSTPEEDKTAKKEVEEERVIKVERKGLLGQFQNFFAWIGAWPNIPQKVLILRLCKVYFLPSDPISIIYLSLGFCFN